MDHILLSCRLGEYFMESIFLPCRFLSIWQDSSCRAAHSLGRAALRHVRNGIVEGLMRCSEKEAVRAILRHLKAKIVQGFATHPKKTCHLSYTIIDYLSDAAFNPSL